MRVVADRLRDAVSERLHGHGQAGLQGADDLRAGLCALYDSAGVDWVGDSMDDKEINEIETNIFDEVEIYENCSVQILRNSVTGEESVGWWINE